MSNFDFDSAKQNIANLLDGKTDSIRAHSVLMSRPDISIPTGKRTVQKKELVLADGSKVSSKKISSGALEWFPQEKLNAFATLRKSACDAFDDVAVSLGANMFLISLDIIQQLLDELTMLEARWKHSLAELEQNYDAWIESYKEDNPDIAYLVDEYRLPFNEFIAVFKWHINPALAVTPLFPEQEEQIVSNAIETLWKEIAEEALAQHKTSFSKGEYCSQKAVTALGRIRNKLVSLTFLHPGIAQIVDCFDNVKQQLPKTGKIEGVYYHQLGHFVLQLGDENRLKATANGDDDGINIPSFYDDSVQTDAFDNESTNLVAPPVSSLLDDELTDVALIPVDDDLSAPIVTHQPVQSEMDWMEF